MAKLKRQLGMGHVISLILGTVIGSGVFINLPIVAKVTGSPWLAVIAWVIGGLIWLPQLFILAEMATAYPEEGFGYLYFKKAGSPALGFLYVWTVFWTSDTPSITIVGMSAISALSVFWPGFDIPIYTRTFASLIIVLLTAIHYRSVKGGGISQIIFTVTKLSPLILLCILGIVHFDLDQLYIKPASIVKANSSYLNLMVAGVAATIWSYAGFTNILYMAGEIKEPKKIIPRSLLLSVAFVTIVYSLIALSTSIFVPYDELISTSGKFANPFIYLPAFAKIAAAFLALAAFTSMVGCMNAMIMIQPRIEYAIARDGLFFKPFAHVHPKYKTPDYSILLQSGLAIILLFVGGIEGLLGYFTLSYLLQNAMVYCTIFFLKKRDDYQPQFKSPARLVMVILAIGTQIYLLYGTFVAYPTGGVISAAVLIGTGLPMYYYFKSRTPEEKYVEKNGD
ncbi:MAG TPA: amino acid permease [bacterium]|nr:amino acid permease [bacterium]